MIAVLFVLLCTGEIAAAQAPTEWSTSRAQMNREALKELLARYEEAMRSDAYSDDFRARARQEATLIRTRLEQGDFQAGDQIQLVVIGEEELTNTFTVEPDRTLVLPVGDIPLTGVLRSELEPHMEDQLSRYIREPAVQAKSTMRVSVLGSVGNPGFYMVPPSQLLTDVVMTAGGPARDAKLTKIYVERNGRRIWEGEPLQNAIVEGRTLDQLSLRAGDRIYVPGQQDRSVVLRTLGAIGAVTGVLWTAFRLYQIAS